MAKSTEIKLAADIIRRVLDAAERGDVEFLDYLKMISRQRFGSAKSGSSSEKTSLDLQRSSGKISQDYLLNEISRFDNEKGLVDYLRSKYPTKTEITIVARALHVPAPKTDDYDALVDRVVGATLGYKMRSQAVRGVQTSRESKKIEDK